MPGNRTSLPPAEDNTRDSIEFATEEKIKPVQSLTAADRVRDEQLKKLIVFEEQPENQIVVSENPSKYHSFVRDTKAALAERYTMVPPPILFITWATVTRRSLMRH